MIVKSNYGLYIEEREDVEIIENGKGFLTYKYNKDWKCLMIFDCFIRKEYRGQGEARRLFDRLYLIAEEMDCYFISAETDTTTNNWKIADKALKNNGYKKISYDSETKMNFYKKDL